MKRIIVVVLLAMALAACNDKGEELYETAQFEEQQFNHEHARQLYQQIVTKYPESPWADKAKERLEALEK